MIKQELSIIHLVTFNVKRTDGWMRAGSGSWNCNENFDGEKERFTENVLIDPWQKSLIDLHPVVRMYRSNSDGCKIQTEISINLWNVKFGLPYWIESKKSPKRLIIAGKIIKKILKKAWEPLSTGGSVSHVILGNFTSMGLQNRFGFTIKSALIILVFYLFKLDTELQARLSNSILFPRFNLKAKSTSNPNRQGEMTLSI